MAKKRPNEEIASTPHPGLSRALSVGETDLELSFCSGWLISLHLAKIIAASDEDDREGPSWDSSGSELRLTHDEAVQLANSLLGFAATLKATVAPEYLSE